MVKDAAGTPQKKKLFSSNKTDKADETLKASRLQTNGDKDEVSKYAVVYYRGENMKRDLSKMLNLRQAKAKANNDTSYHEIPHDHIAYRYECIRSLGKGSFGNVILAIDHKENIDVAVKVVRRDIRFTTQAKEEIAILETLQRLNPNPKGPSDRFPIVRMIEHFMFRDHMCLTFELLGCSLYDLIKDKKDQGLPRDRVRRLMSSVLDGLTYVWNAGIIHCDLKPENVLLVSRASDGGPDEIRDHVKIIDFGSSCFIGKQCYPYIQSRFYRAPEVIMRSDYNRPIDIWSFGCLVFEMIRGYPLFPGEDEFDQLACMMEKLGMPPLQMVENSRVFSRYFAEPEASRKYYSPLDKQTPLKLIPRYCTIHQNQDGSAELRPNLSKKTRRLRKPPGSVKIAQALVSTLSHSSGKYNDYTPTPSETLDNIHVVKLIEACLSWQPEKRINPTQAKTFSWFNYKSNLLSDTYTMSLLSRSRSPASSKHSSASSQHSIYPDVTSSGTFKSGTVLLEAPAQVAFASSIGPNSSEVRTTSPKVVAARASLGQANYTVSTNQTTIITNNNFNINTTGVTDTVPIHKRKVKASFTSASPPGPELPKRHGSPASISSGENKQEERVIYARSYKPVSPKTNVSFRHNANLPEKMSDISLQSLDSSIDDIAPRQQDISRYTRKNGLQPSDRFHEPSTRLRKRNQSMEPKRHTQPVRNEVIIKEKSILPSRSYITSMTTALSSSPEEESEKSGRHNPNAFLKTSRWDLTSVEHSEPKATYINNRMDPARARKHITPRTEPLTLDKRQNLAKTRSAIDFPINFSLENSDESEGSKRRPIVESTLRAETMRRPNFREQLIGSKLTDTGISPSPKQLTKASSTKGYHIRDSSGKVIQSQGDYRRRRMPNKTNSSNHLVELTEVKLSSSRSNENLPGSRVHTTRADGEEMDAENANSFMDINKLQPSVMMIKPQT
nr:dual specificity [Hymenolepis microstoma]